MEEQGISQLDYIVVTPDAYVDHPSFAAAIIGRFVQSLGYSVGVISQPDWTSAEDFNKLGTPKYAFLISGGNMDGIVNMYTAAKKLRSSDAYSPGGKIGLRPPRPTIAYTARLKQSHKDTPVIIGGVEPSNRRFAHYDYYEDKVRRSYLVDSKADMLVYGMGEKPLEEITERLKAGEKIDEICGVRGTCVLRSNLEDVNIFTMLPSFDKVSTDKKAFAECCRLIHNNMIPDGKTLVQEHSGRYVVQFPPSYPITTSEMDAIYGLPFTRRQHPSYGEPVPALSEVQFSITSLRGCPGMCSFCSISAHQGKRIQKRSLRSIVKEAEDFSAMPEFKGVISDVGGPTANFYDAVCTAKNSWSCTKSCLSPTICKNLKVSHKGLCEVLEGLERVPAVRKIFIRSGIRYDYLAADKDGKFIKRLVKKHTSGQLKTAPEHVSGDVLELMNKPSYRVYENFAKRFSALSGNAGKEQYLLPYYISSHPGSTLESAIELALKLKKQKFIPEQVQDFYPTPGTISTCMYYTGINPLTGKDVYVARTPKEKAMQRALLQFNNRRNWPLIREALKEAGREDLIGRGGDCLVPEEPAKSRKTFSSENTGTPKSRKTFGGENAGTPKSRETFRGKNAGLPKSREAFSSENTGSPKSREAFRGKNAGAPKSREAFSSENTGSPKSREAFRGKNAGASKSRETFRDENTGTPKSRETFRGKNAVAPKSRETFRVENTGTPKSREAFRVENTGTPKSRETFRGKNAVAPKSHEAYRGENTGSPKSREAFRSEKNRAHTGKKPR